MENNQYWNFAHVDAGKTTPWRACYMPAEPFQNRERRKRDNEDGHLMFLERQRDYHSAWQSLPSSGTDAKVNIVDTPGRYMVLSECTALWLF